MTDATELPPAVTTMFDGSDLADKCDVSAMLLSVDAKGWPHVGFLSVGEVLVRDPRSLRLTLWRRSSTTANIARSRQASLFSAAAGIVWEARLHLETLASPDDDYRIFAATVTEVRRHQAPYAEVGGLIAFRLLDPAASIARWQEQVDRMKDAG